MKYSIFAEVVCQFELEIEADSEEEAEAFAKDDIYGMSISEGDYVNIDVTDVSPID